MSTTDFLRTKYMATGLASNDLSPDPYYQFQNWYQEVLASDLPEPTAMSLATVDENGQPWQRMVLLKVYDVNGFVFFTNYTSRKAQHITKNPNISLLFPWQALGRQVKITGTATKISTAESVRYFTTRPRGSQLGAWASPQSQVITNRALLDTLLEQAMNKFHQGNIPLPDFWGGYRVTPATFEFWQARENRLHDRFLYTKDPEGMWTFSRLGP